MASSFFFINKKYGDLLDLAKTIENSTMLPSRMPTPSISRVHLLQTLYFLFMDNHLLMHIIAILASPHI
ncbi:uncharacterized protein FIBRA_09000 [Fibroporia radiculosa]|uniref:Uncharacterized protein n=1 Tax=Fibroporia radiculosa TaxID=599839 RepID=J4GXS0_9APHY|nr:uncharacterized protein FIBRA_09000 [Fibroporia radiculosa]CCM06710.1 predicted protein [Fibroporia radiculosa]